MSLRKLGVLGWGTIYSLVFHLTLIVTGKEKLLSKWWIYVVMYVPVAINLLVFLVFWESADQHYHIFSYQLGWTNLWVNTFWNWFHTLQFLVFSLGSVALIIHWYFTTKSRAEKSQEKWIAISFTVTLVLGMATDFVTREQEGAFPQLGIVFIMFPILTFFFMARK